MARSAIGAAVGVIAAAAMASCGGGTLAPTGPPVATSMPTPATVPPHDLAVALRKVTTQGGAELTATGNDLARAGSLDVAAQTMGDHATTFSSLHSTLDQLPGFPVAQTQRDVGRLSADLASLSSVISAMLAAEVSQYAEFKRQITAQIPTVRRDMATVDNDLKGY